MAKKQKDIADILRDAIANSGRSVYAVAKDAGIAMNTMYRFVRCEADLSMKNASKLCRVLNLELKPKG